MTFEVRMNLPVAVRFRSLASERTVEGATPSLVNGAH